MEVPTHTRKPQSKKIAIWIRQKRILVAAALVSLGCAAVVLTVLGYAGAVINVYPYAKIGHRTTTLSCNYRGQEIKIDAEVHSNINTYYQYNGHKRNLFKKGDFSKYVYENHSDSTLRQLASRIKGEAEARALNDDQVLELTTCLIQNIPYDEARGNRILVSGNESGTEQYPYETLYRNRGICTDKTYLGSALLRELGYGTGILIFPEDKHMALGVSVPGGYTNFDSKYAMMELTTTGFAPGEVPYDIDDNNGRPSATINTLSDLDIATDPAGQNYDFSASIHAPTLVIDVSQGKQYERIVTVKNLENKIINGVNGLKNRQAILSTAYSELNRRDYSRQSAYSTYLLTPSTKYECGYKYNYTYTYSYSYPYTYQSPYTYQCDYVTNSQKNYDYYSYTAALSSYNNQVAYYNGLIKEYNSQVSTIQRDIATYRQYDYN